MKDEEEDEDNEIKPWSAGICFVIISILCITIYAILLLLIAKSCTS